MRRRAVSLRKWAPLLVWVLLFPVAASSQQTPPQSRIVGPVDEAARVTLRGNTHPLAQPQFDRGSAPPDLPMARMLLVLKRSAAQEAALEKLLDDQQDLNSASYHQWLTPDQFGQQFGPSDQDIQTISAWLRTHGFQVATPSRGRTVIEFSGTAAQVQQAFRTEIHKFTVNGEDHWANASDPQIPAALAPVVAGINTLYNFPRQQMHVLAGNASRGGPFYTFPSGCGVTSTSPSFCNFAVSPADFAKIYNVPNLLNPPPAPAAPFNGDGETIAIVGVSHINTTDVAQFRAFFGLPPLTPQQLSIIVNGPDPGTNGAEIEADLDVELAGSVAPNAKIDLVIAQGTEVSLGVDLAAQYAVDNNIGDVLNESFGACEFFMGTTNNVFQNQLWQQAAAQGTSVFVSSGDSGSALCDGNLGSNGPAQLGLSVSGSSSTPYNVSVGGTDFNEVNNWLAFWNLNSDPVTLESAKGYIPEVPWNDTCTNPEVPSILGLPESTTAEQMCNNTSATSQFPFLLDPIAGSGGKSGCTTSDTNPATGTGTLSSCGGGYGKPSWQTALTPNDNKRDLPDVSLFASAGFNDSFYAICSLDAPGQAVIGPCGNSLLMAIGGTSASSPAFAAIMALVDQAKGGSRQGNPNYILYKLAAQAGNTCTSAANPATTCVFYDIPNKFTIAMPCASGKPDCNVTTPGDAVGVLSGYPTSSGYDLATGLGSVNAANLIKNWKSFPLTASTTTLTLTPPNGSMLTTLTHGQSVGVKIIVAPQIGSEPPTPAGNVSLIANTGPNGTEGVQGFTLSSGAATGTTTSLPGGSYTVIAQYAGDGTFASSAFSAPIPVIVAPEASQPNIALELFDPITGAQTNANASTASYGSLELLRMNVTSKAGDACAQNAPGATGCPTGSVTITNNGAPLDAGTYALNSQGYAEDFSVQLPGGTNNLALAYPGDNSFAAGNGTSTITITPAPTMTTVFPPPSVIIGQAFNINADMVSNSFGVAPTGAFTALDGAVQVGSTGSLTGSTNPFSGQVFLNGGIQATLIAPSGPHTLTAHYSGDTNYAGSTSSGIVVNALYATAATAMANPITINLGQSTSVTATVTGASKTPTMTGTFQFPGLANPVVGTPGPPDASGNQTLTATAMVQPQFSGFLQVNYSGDSNYESANAGVNVTVNQPDFTIGTGSSNLSITAGQTGMTQITIMPVNNISDSVVLGCNAQQMANVTCSFNPPSPLSVSNMTAATTTLSIGTLAPSSSPSTTFIGTHRPRWEGIWPPGSWMFALADGLAILLLSLSASRKKRCLAGALGMAGLLFLVLSCGSGGGGGGGGGGGPVPTTLTLTTSSVKAPAGTNFTLTATVHSTNPVTGVVYFIDNTQNTDIQGVLVNGVASVQLAEAYVGTHVMSAQYPGDANNQASQTKGSINQVITGTGQLSVNATGAANGHSTTINVTIQ